MTLGAVTPAQMVALNADVVGYSQLLSDDFESTMASMEEVRCIVSERVAGGGGTLADFVGDNFMAIFGDPRDAVGTAIAIATEIEARNADVPKPSQLRFRMGLDQGEVAITDDRYLGDPLNIAARIQALTPPGGVSVSGRVYRALDEPALRFRSTGRHKLKNIPERVEVFQFADLPVAGAAPPSRRSLSLESPRLAILPIHTEMVDDAVRATAGVIRRDLVHRLSAVPQLTVVDAKTEPGEGGVGSSARYMVETGVHQFGDRVRVYATLFDVTTMNVVKSHKWMADAGEMFALSDEIANEVARGVEVELVVGEPAGLYADLDDPEAIEKVYLGWYHLRSDTREGWAHALDLFGQVAQAHPGQPFGYVLSAFANWIGASNEWVPDPAATFRKAREQARVAEGIGDPSGMAKAVEAAILMSEGKPEAALETMEQLEIIRPTCDVTYGLEGSVRRYLGQWERAVELMDVAMRLTGINKPWYPTVKACSLFIGGRLEEAAAIAEEVLEYQPKNLEALLVLVAAQVELGLQRRAQATTDVIRTRFPSMDLGAWLDKNPYQRREIVERWKDDLISAGAIGGA